MKFIRTAYNSRLRFGGNRDFVLKRDGFKCVQCGMSSDEHKIIYKREITVDHIDGKGRYDKNPNHELSNLQTLCLSCHGRKDVIRRKHLRGRFSYR